MLIDITKLEKKINDIDDINAFFSKDIAELKAENNILKNQINDLRNIIISLQNIELQRSENLWSSLFKLTDKKETTKLKHSVIKLDDETDNL